MMAPLLWCELPFPVILLVCVAFFFGAANIFKQSDFHVAFFYHADTPQTKLNHGQGSVHCKSGCSECRIMREDGTVPCVPVGGPFPAHAPKDEAFVRKCAMRWRQLAARGATKKERADHVSKYGQRDSPMLSVAGYQHGIRQILETMHMLIVIFFSALFFCLFFCLFFVYFFILFLYYYCYNFFFSFFF